MHPLAYFLTQKITRSISKKSALDGTAEDGSGLVLFLFFGLPAAVGLCTQYTCLLTHEEAGFNWRNRLRISRRYSYEEVTGLYISPLRVVELKSGKRQDLDKSWRNRYWA